MRRLIPSLVATVALAAGCGGGDAGTATGSENSGAPGGGVTAAAAVFPLAWMAQEIAPGAEVEFLGAGSQEAHGLDLTPGQRGAVESADVLLYLGDVGYQPQVEAAADSAGGVVVDVAAVVGPDRLRPAADDPHGHGEEAGDAASTQPADDHAAGDDEAAEEGHSAPEQHTEGSVDVHVWFNATLMADVAQRVGAAFAEADPSNAEAYTANAERVRTQLLGVAGEVDRLLGGECRFDEAVVSHAAYGYLLSPHGIGQHGLVGVASGEAGASSRELAEVVAEVEAEGFTHVLAEPVEGRADAEAVAREAGVQLLEVYPLDVVADELAQRGYPTLLREQAETFATALGCG
ncbi:MAG: metal ABC transporter substrate-binding protein [Actinomycetota bacterium]|nr:metal ABC transporter substrate-binding protein [Actinomycetota bacterium]